MVNVTLDELRLNAIFAALYEREHRLALELAHLTGQPESRDREFAMDCVALAIQHSYLARRDLTAAIPDDHSAHEEPVVSCADCQEAAAAMWQRMAV